MKKALSILLIICLTVTSVFSSYTAKAEENSQSEGLVVLESDFSSTTNWIMRNQYFVKYLDENQDGINDYARITSSTKASTGLKSAPFVLIPGDEYELTYYVRVPNGEGGSAEFYQDSTKIYPRYAIYQPTLNEDGTQVTSNYTKGQNDYAYNGVRRSEFDSYWQIGDYEPYNRAKYSFIDSVHDTACNGESPNTVYADWTKVTVNFTALDDEANDCVGDQIVALCFDFSKNKELEGLIYDIKDVVLIDKSKEAVEPEEPETPEEPEDTETKAIDFEDATKWGLNGYKSTQLEGNEGHVTPESYMSVDENTDSTYILDGDSSIVLKTNSRWYDYKLTGLKSNTKYALKFSYFIKDTKNIEITKNLINVYGIFNYAASGAKLTSYLGYLNYVSTSGYAYLDNNGEGTVDYNGKTVRAIVTEEKTNFWYTATVYFNTSEVKDTLAFVIRTNYDNTILDKFQLIEVDYTNPAQDVNAPEISGKTKKGPFISENTTSYLYEDCTLDDYEAYLANLENLEFEEYATNAYGENKFATFTKGNTVVHVTYTPVNGTILVTDQATDTLPTTKEQNIYEDKGIQPLIIQLDHNNTTNGGIGMSYIVRLADGSFIIVDGGHTEKNYDNANRLYDLLRQYTPEGKIQIAAWLITHCHSDHIGGFISFVERYSNEADIEQVIYNTATYGQFKANADASNKATQKEAILLSYINQDAFTATIALLKLNGTKISTCHSGYEYNIRNAVINVMFTLEDVFPKVFSVDHNDANNTCSVFKISFTDENVDQTLLITGDSSTYECDAMYAKYTGDELKSTFVQAIHHGISCGSYELYSKMNPEVVLWPSGCTRIINQLYQSQNQYFVDEQSGVKEIVLSDYGTRTFALPYTAPEGLTGFERFTLPDDIENVNSLEHYFGTSIRKAEGDTKQALRFKIGMPEQIIKSQTESGYKVAEYGAMVSEFSTSLNYYAGNKAYVTENNIKTYKAVAYNKAENRNIVFDYYNYNNLDDGISRMTNFTCALNNIGVDKFGNIDYSKYDTTYYVRVYIVFENADGDTKVYYGDVQSASVFAVMQTILTSTATDDQTVSDQTYVKNFLDGKVEGFTADAAAIKAAWISDETRATLYTPAN